MIRWEPCWERRNDTRETKIVEKIIGRDWWYERKRMGEETGEFRLPMMKRRGHHGDVNAIRLWASENFSCLHPITSHSFACLFPFIINICIIYEYNWIKRFCAPCIFIYLSLQRSSFLPSINYISYLFTISSFTKTFFDEKFEKGEEGRCWFAADFFMEEMLWEGSL